VTDYLDRPITRSRYWLFQIIAFIVMRIASEFGLGPLALVVMTLIAMGRLSDIGWPRWIALVPASFVMSLILVQRVGYMSANTLDSFGYPALFITTLLMAFIGFWPSQAELISDQETVEPKTRTIARIVSYSGGGR
jgi:hypothetical protein